MLKLSAAPLRKPMSRLPELTMMLIPRSSFHGKDAARKGPGAVLEGRGPAQQRLCSMVKARAWLHGQGQSMAAATPAHFQKQLPHSAQQGQEPKNNNHGRQFKARNNCGPNNAYRGPPAGNRPQVGPKPGNMALRHKVLEGSCRCLHNSMRLLQMLWCHLPHV